MIDIHAPHEKIHGFGDFLLHLLTITIGLLIALGLEGCVEWQHHRELVKEARANLHSEFQDNQKTIADALTAIHQEQQQAKDDIRTLRAMQANPKSKGSVIFRFSSDTLEQTSWDTSRETGALAYMPYAEVKSYAEAIDLENQYNAHQEKLIGNYTQAIAYLEQFNDNATSKDIGATAQQGIQIALGIQGELMLCENLAEALQKQYVELLGGPGAASKTSA